MFEVLTRLKLLNDGKILLNKAKSYVKVINYPSQRAGNFLCLKQVLQTHHRVTGQSVNNNNNNNNNIILI